MFGFSVFFAEQNSAYEMRISDWSSDVCSPDLLVGGIGEAKGRAAPGRVRDREAAALAGGGGADLRSKLGEPPFLDAAWCSPHARKTLTGGFNEQIGKETCRGRVCPHL